MADDMSRREFIKNSTIAGVGAMALPALAQKLEPNTQAVAQRMAAKVANAIPKLDGTFNVNGIEHKAKFDARTTLLDLLREEFKLTGAKKGCDHGQCGACTVIVNGKRINSCLSLAAQNQKKKILTIEGLAKGSELHPMQQAFLENDAFQCGYCTPGQIMSSVALLSEPCGKTEDDVRECMSGNLCRCGAYRNILAAIEQVRAKGPKHGTV